jgi:hypothetical protein
MKIQRNSTRVRGGKMNKALFAVFLVGIGTAAPQTPPPDQTRQIQLQKEALRRAARSAPVKIIGFPTLRPLRPPRILGPLKKMENK